jgi:hypothetical protein
MDTSLINRCRQAYEEGTHYRPLGDSRGIRSVIEYLAAELVVLNHSDAANALLKQLTAEVIPLRPDRGGAA